MDLPKVAAEKSCGRLWLCAWRRLERGDQRGGTRRTKALRREFEPSRAYRAHRGPRRQSHELRSLLDRKTGGEQMNIPQPQQIDGVLMMCHTVKTRDKQRIRNRERTRVWPKHGDRHRSHQQLVKRDCATEELWIGDLPVEIEVLRDCRRRRRQN